ncbi:LysR family transcriptional regulator, partial [Enterobacter mori]|uniref:LysR family transcriptional regulator n=1 Tax=Enterobacter mori TaxID=539813 RepID=UPI0032AFC65E
MRECSHFAGNNPQSGASQAIAQLEASLGFTVFTRERRHIGVTALGERVVKEARSMLAKQIDQPLHLGITEAG